MNLCNVNIVFQYAVQVQVLLIWKKNAHEREIKEEWSPEENNLFSQCTI